MGLQRAIDDGEEGEPRVHVAIAAGDRVNVELLYPGLGLEGPLRAAVKRHEFDAEALIAAARAAIAAPDRLVTLDVDVRATA